MKIHDYMLSISDPVPDKFLDPFRMLQTQAFWLQVDVLFQTTPLFTI